MTSFKELIANFGNGRRDNVIFTLDAGEEMILHFKDSGDNDATNRYYDLKSEAKKVVITVNKIATITHIGNQELQSPRTLGTDTPNIWSSGIEWLKIKVRAELAATTFEVYAS